MLCVHETGWKGNKAKQLGEGKLLSSEMNAKWRNGVRLMLSNELKDHTAKTIQLYLRGATFSIGRVALFPAAALQHHV